MRKIVDLNYPLRGRPALAFRGRLRRYSSRDLHRHPHHEVLLIRNGVSLLIDERWRQPLLGTCLALIPARVAHRSLVVGQGLEYQGLFLHRRRYPLESVDIEIIVPSELGLALFNRLCAADGARVSGGAAGECLALFLRVLEEDRRNRSRLARLPEAKDPLNAKIAGYLRANYARKISMPEIEEAAHYSARHVSRRFAQELGFGIFEYLRLHRIHMAGIFLSDPARKITDIAFACGYGSVSSFYRDFRSFFGIPPKELRSRLG